MPTRLRHIAAQMWASLPPKMPPFRSRAQGRNQSFEATIQRSSSISHCKDVVCNNFCSRPWPSCLDLYPCAWRRLNFSLHSALSVSHLSTLNTITASVWRFRALCSRNCHVGNRAWPLLWSGRPRPPGCTHDCKRLCKLLGCSCITTLDQKPLESAGEALGTFGRGLRSSGIFG